jgi:hypothetical protein
MQAGKFALAFGLALALAAAHAEGSDEHAPVYVSVTNGQITVSEDPLTTSESEGGLNWAIATAGYLFAQNGIDIGAPPGVHECQVIANGQGVHCRKNKHLSGAKFKYTVNLVEGSSGRPLPPLDPFILNR